MRDRTVPATPPLIDDLGTDTVLTVSTELDKAHPRNHLHCHPHGELYLLRSGYLRSESQAGRWLIRAGLLCWVPPFVVHGGQTDGVDRVRIQIAPQLCESLPQGQRVFTMAREPMMLAIINRLADDPGPRTTLSTAESHLLDVFRDEVERARNKRTILLPMPKNERLRHIAERWLENPDDSAALDSLAVDAHMSRRNFTRNFKQETGLAVGTWRQIARLVQAIDMFASGKSVTEITYALGYDSLSSFGALCQKHTGMSPKVLAQTVTSGDWDIGFL